MNYELDDILITLNDSAHMAPPDDIAEFSLNFEFEMWTLESPNKKRAPPYNA